MKFCYSLPRCQKFGNSQQRHKQQYGKPTISKRQDLQP